MFADFVDIQGYEGLYRINQKGQVYSHYSNKILRGRVHSGGYLRVSIGRKDCYIHRLVVQTFIGPIGSLEINHKNGIKKDNRLCNLEMVTRRENIRHAFATGLNHVGEKNRLSKITEKIARELKYHKINNCAELSRLYNIPRRTINNIRNGNSWRHI